MCLPAAFPTQTLSMLITKVNVFHYNLICTSWFPRAALSWFSFYLTTASLSPPESPDCHSAADFPTVVFSPLLLQARPLAIPPVLCYMDHRSLSTRRAVPKLQPLIADCLLTLPPYHLNTSNSTSSSSQSFPSTLGPFTLYSAFPTMNHTAICHFPSLPKSECSRRPAGEAVLPSLK